MFSHQKRSMSVIIRPIRKSDNSNVARMIRAVFVEFDAPTEGTIFTDKTTDTLFELFQEKNAALWIAEKDSEIVGCCGIFPTVGLPEKCTELVKFYVSNSVRGTGIGRQLMQKSEEFAIKLGYSEIYIESLPAFGNAVRIYKKNGYSLLDHPLGNSGHFGCDIWMVKSLITNT